jgi:hypothetical protein
MPTDIHNALPDLGLKGLLMTEDRSKRTKKCPYCSVPLNLNADECFSCNQKIGKINKHGMAERPTNYWSYVICALAWAGFFFYIRWAFF